MDGETARQRGLAVHIEVWVQHWLLRDTFKVGGGEGPQPNAWPGEAMPARGQCTAAHPPKAACPQGRVSIPLEEVIGRRRLQDTWPLQGGQQGTLSMQLSWLGALQL